MVIKQQEKLYYHCQPLQAGFTLIELIIVIILTAIIAAYASSRWTNTVDLNAQAQQLVADIRYTQSLAMTKGERYRLTITTSTNSYAISSTSGSAVNNTVTNNPITYLANGITFSTISGLAAASPYYIAFNGYGVPYKDATASTTPLTAVATITLTKGGRTRQIQITSAGLIIAP